MITEKQRNEDKLDRLLKRNDKILNQIMKSKTTKLQKTDNYQTFTHFITDLCCELEKKYPYLKQEITYNKKDEARWAKPIPTQ
ncbi:MAG: hypothetical protein IAX22_00550 [Candidatus Bathyarchaeota archaeon]|nr:hypothetical protein [Candidatus Bathyarchaeota archaeon]